MKPFKANGVWFLPNDPSKRSAGTLYYGKGGIRLRLTEGFAESWGGMHAERYPSIFGIINKHASGSFVTLAHCIETRHSLSMPGFAMQEIRARVALIGQENLSEENRLFKGLMVRFTNFDDWYNAYNFEWKFHKDADRIAGVEVVYHRPIDRQYPIRDKALHITSAFSQGGGIRTAAVRETPYFLMDNLEPTDLDKLTDDYIQALRNFISLAADSPSPIESLLLAHPTAKNTLGRPAWFSVLRDQVMQPTAIASSSSGREMLFTYKDVADRDNVMQEWFSFSDRLKYFCAMYFNHLFAPLSFVEEKFARTMLELRVFLRCSREPIPSAVRARQKIAESEIDNILGYPRQLVDYCMPDEAD